MSNACRRQHNKHIYRATYNPISTSVHIIPQGLPKPSLHTVIQDDTAVYLHRDMNYTLSFISKQRQPGYHGHMYKACATTGQQQYGR